MALPDLECRLVLPDDAGPLGRFFQRLVTAGEDRFFHPHPLTVEEAAIRCNYCGKDIYYLLIEAGEIIGYGMLRGWDEGFDVPSLGIAIDPGAQGRGLGRYLMEFLHTSARQCGARHIRLKVYPDNGRARAFYHSLGYEFFDEQNGQLVGILDLEK